MVLVLGAGLAGLSAAHHLGGDGVLVAERESAVGGLCRSIREAGFTFDYTGHLLHLRDDALRTWVKELLPGGWTDLHRSAWIHSHDVLTPYPFQANIADLPVEVKLACLQGFIETLRHPERRGVPVPDAELVDPSLPFLKVVPPVAAGEPSFKDWILDTFGPGFSDAFFEPYNRKMWRRDLSEVTGDWVSWSIPRPELGDVLRGAITRSEKAFGYNPDFLYPTAGGIDHLPRALAATLPRGVVRTGMTVASLDAGSRRVTLVPTATFDAASAAERGGTGAAALPGAETHDAPAILTSLPLTALARFTTDLPEGLRDAVGELSSVSIRAVNLGVRGPAFHPDAQWVYVPEADAPFHRVGLPAALTPAMAPDGHHALVAEISFTPSDDPGPTAHLEQTVEALTKRGFLADPADIVHTRIVDIEHAYVVFDRQRREVLPALLRWYLDRGVVPMGRYGTWDYLAMQDSLIHGREAAAWATARVS